MPQSSGPSTADEIVEQGYRSVNNITVRMFTRVLESNPGADLGDVLQMALRKYASLRYKVEERPQQRQRKGLHLVWSQNLASTQALTPDAVNSVRDRVRCGVA